MENILLIAVITLGLSIALIVGIAVYTFTGFEELPKLEGQNHPANLKSNLYSLVSVLYGKIIFIY